MLSWLAQVTKNLEVGIEKRQSIVLPPALGTAVLFVEQRAKKKGGKVGVVTITGYAPLNINFCACVLLLSNSFNGGNAVLQLTELVARFALDHGYRRSTNSVDKTANCCSTELQQKQPF